MVNNIKTPTSQANALQAIVQWMNKKGSLTFNQLTEVLVKIGSEARMYQRTEDGRTYQWRSDRRRKTVNAERQLVVGDVNHLDIQLGTELSHVTFPVYENDQQLDTPFYYIHFVFEIREQANNFVVYLMNYLPG